MILESAQPSNQGKDTRQSACKTSFGGAIRHTCRGDRQTLSAPLPIGVLKKE